MDDVPPLFRHLIDDAALFPPGDAPMAVAVPAHRALRTGPYDELVGPFLCPASRLAELGSELGEGDRFDLGLIVDTGLESVADVAAEAAKDERLSLAMVEVPVPAGTDLVAGAERCIDLAPADSRLFVELPRSTGWREALAVVARAGRGAKLRTGGLRAELFPTDAELAAFIASCAERRVPFKCTAGLHHAVRHRDPDTGFRHHGFLNILVATCRAVTATPGTTALDEALAEERPEQLAEQAAGIGATTASEARRLFASYGSCRIDEPVADLRALGLLP